MSQNLQNVSYDKFLTLDLLIKEGSFSRAAEKSGRSYSSLVNDIHSLERGLDMRIYKSTKKIFVPTQEAVEMLQVAKDMFERFEYVRKKNLNPKDEVTINIVTTQSAHLIFLEKFVLLLNENNLLTFYLRLGKFDTVNVMEIDFDIFIGNTNLTDAISRKLLMKAKYGLYASKKYLKDRNIEKIEDIHGVDLLLFDGIHELSEDIVKRNNVRFYSNSYVTLLNACAHGLGIASLPIDLVLFENKKDLVRIDENYLSEHFDVFFYYKKFSNKENLMLEIFDKLKEQYGEIRHTKNG